MKVNQKSIRDGIEDFLCPFTDMYITQGSNGGYSHQGIMANDVRGKEAGVRYPYYAPCTCKCVQIVPSYGQAMWQSTAPVRFANGRIDYATFVTAHDDSFNVKVGQIVPQGVQLGNMGTKGQATGVHCHIQVSQSKDTSWYKNQYGNNQMNHEYDLDACYFLDDTNILSGTGDWKYLKDVPVGTIENKTEFYQTNYNMHVRTGPGITSAPKKVKDLTIDGKRNATSQDLNQDAIYKKGTVFTAKEIIQNQDGSLWGHSPSGYICIQDNDMIYCTKK